MATFFDKYETAIDKLEKSITAWILDRETSDAARELNSARNTVDDLFNHYRNEEAIAKHHKAEELRTALAARTEWANVAVVKKALEDASTKVRRCLTLSFSVFVAKHSLLSHQKCRVPRS